MTTYKYLQGDGSDVDLSPETLNVQREIKGVDTESVPDWYSPIDLDAEITSAGLLKTLGKQTITKQEWEALQSPVSVV